MEIYAHQTVSEGVKIEIGRNSARVRVPVMEFQTDYYLLKEQLLSELCRRPATTWIVDLSDHRDGVTLALAGVLAGFCEEARRSGNTVRCTGLQKPCVTCQTERKPAPRPAERRAIESWIGRA